MDENRGEISGFSAPIWAVVWSLFWSDGGREKQSGEEQGDEKTSHIKGYRGQEKERKKERAFSTPVSRTKRDATFCRVSLFC